MTYLPPNPDDPQDLAKRLRATDVPWNKGAAMMINAPSLVEGYACASCGNDKTYTTPIRLTRDQVRHAACGKCGGERLTLRLRGGM